MGDLTISKATKVGGQNRIVLWQGLFQLGRCAAAEPLTLPAAAPGSPGFRQLSWFYKMPALPDARCAPCHSGRDSAVASGVSLSPLALRSSRAATMESRPVTAGAAPVSRRGIRALKGCRR
jgi:hypothetical protein